MCTESALKGLELHCELFWVGSDEGSMFTKIVASPSALLRLIVSFELVRLLRSNE
jgi:hypothetical protein